ncbi:MAG: YdcF family protein [Planctomycetes bacterium]|nr:YdcF family protein [Planctomycetota bacterium]
MLIALLILLFTASKAWLAWRDRAERTPKWWLGVGTVAAGVVGLGVVASQDLVVQKALGLLLMPASVAWLLLAGLAIAAWGARRRRTAIAATAIWVLYTVAGNVWVGNALLGSLETRIPPRTPASLPGVFDAVFVLGGGTTLGSDGRPQLGSGGDRLALAAQLFAERKTLHLVASGNSMAGLDMERDLAEETATLWRGMGVPDAVILSVGTPAVNTRQEIAAYKRMVDERHWENVALVSSAWHLPRALALCEKAGLKVTPLGADRRGRIASWSPLYLIPQNFGFDAVQVACYEYLGRWVGR